MSKGTLDGFNKIAPVYDTLARLVYGKSIVEAQTHYVALLKNAKHILVLGGGSGWIVEELFKYSAAEISYVEASSAMMALTKQRNIPINRINFIYGTEDQIPAGSVFDVVITNFYLDLFTEGKQREIMEKINLMLSKEGMWMVSDFVNNGTWWHRFLLVIMHQFFRRLCKIEAHELADWETALRENGLKPMYAETFYKGFIKSTVFVKE